MIMWWLVRHPLITMLTRRNWVLRFSIILNIVVIVYVGVVSKSGGNVWIEELQVGARNLDAFDQEVVVVDESSPNVIGTVSAIGAVAGPSSDLPSSPAKSPQSISPSTTQQNSSPTSAQTTSTEPTLGDVVRCNDKSAEPRTAQRADFWVLYNYIPARRTFHCWETITYTTHADLTFLDNLKPLLERWQGPISLAMHAPGTDFEPTLDAIQFARQCLSPLVAELVTFHIFFGARHMPKVVPPAKQVLERVANCSGPAPWDNFTAASLFKTKAKILYPVNIGRNIARDSATTHYILPSDIELYPSPGVITDFLAMVRRQDPALKHRNPKVFPLAIFELEKGMDLPVNKTQLVSNHFQY